MKKLILFIAFILSVNLLFAQREVDANVVIVRDSIIMTDGQIKELSPGTVGTDAVNLNQLNDSLAANTFVQPLDSLLFSTDIEGLVHEEGKLYYDSLDHTLVFYNDEVDIALQIGQEQWLYALNSSGGDIQDGDVVFIDGASGLTPTIQMAKADLPTTANRTIGMATHTIENGTFGFVTTFGLVRGLNTAAFSSGNTIYLSAATAGEFTETQPEYPNFIITVGSVVVSDASDGVILVNISGRIEDILDNGWNGNFLEGIDYTITAGGGVITGNLARDGAGDLVLNFSDGFTEYDVTPATTVTLTGGTDTNPQFNYTYIPKSTKVLTNSISGWPTEEHIKVSTSFLQTSATTATNGALRNQNWNDHVAGVTGAQGHIHHMAEWIRQNAAIWSDGILGALTIRTASGTPDTLTVSNTGGNIYQLHKQSFGAMDMYTGDDIHMVNDFTTPYQTVSDLSGELTDASGNSLSGRYYSIVVWGVGNRAGEQSHLMANLPLNSYNSSAAAIADADNFSVYTIPTDFTGVGFLIARFTVQHSSASGGTWTLHSTEDLRGQFPSTAAGGGSGGGGGVTTFLGLSDTYNDFLAKGGFFNRVNSGETAVEAVDPGTVDVSIWNDDGTYMDNATHNAAALTGQYVDEASAQTLINKTITNPSIGDFTNSPHDHSNTVNGGTVDYTVLTTKPAITDLENGNTWKVYYSNGTGTITELALGGTDTYLRSGGIATAPNWGTPAGTVSGLDEVTAVDSVSTHKIAAPVFIATVADGTKPFEVTSTTLNNNMNVEFLNGLASTDYGQIGGLTTSRVVRMGASNLENAGIDDLSNAVAININSSENVGIGIPPITRFHAATPVADAKFRFESTHGSGVLNLQLKAAGSATIRYIDELDAIQARIDLSNNGGFNVLNASSVSYLNTNSSGDVNIPVGDLTVTGNAEAADAIAGQDLVTWSQLTDASFDGDFNTLQVNGANVLTSVAVREYWLGANYSYESQTSTPPSTGEIRFNASIGASATSMYVFQTDNDGYDRASELGALVTGDWVTISTTNGENARFILDGPPVDNGTWWTVPVDFKDGAAGISDEDDIALDIFYIPSSLTTSTFEADLTTGNTVNFPIGGPSGTNALTASRPKIISSISIVITDGSDSYIGGAKWVAYYTYNGGTPQVNFSTIFDSAPANITWNPALVSLTPMLTLTNNTGSTIEYFVTYNL